MRVDENESQRGSARTLWQLMSGRRLRYAMAVVAMAGAIALSFGMPLIARAAIDGGLRDVVPEDAGRLTLLARELVQSRGVGAVLWAAAACVVVLAALGGAFEYLHGRWAAKASESIARSLRERLYAQLHRLPCEWHDGQDTGDLVQRCSSDVETVRVFLASQVVTIARSVLLLAIVVPILFSLDMRMALVSLLLYPPIVAFAVAFFRRVKVLFRAVDEAEGRMTTVLQENLTGIRVVRAFARQDHEEEKFGAASVAYRDNDWRLLRMLGGYWSLSDVLCLSQVGLVLILGGAWAAKGELSIGTLYAFLTYEGMVIWPVRHMGRVLTDTGKAIVSVSRIDEVLRATPEEDQGAVLRPVAPALGAIEARGLVKCFGEGVSALGGLDLLIERGETIALLGPPGSGKSTFVHLLLRLYEPDGGSLTLDGRELTELPREHVRESIVAVLQEPFLYSRTLRENLRFGHPTASDEEVADAARAAAVAASIEDFPDGYDTVVGERGVTLSGGQRQRVALARALLADPPVLVLDDSLSAVDTRTEASILARLDARRGRRTTILIAHRLSSALHADRICVLEEGRVAQLGTHASLLREEGSYRRLWNIQGRLEDELDHDLGAVAGERGGA